MDTHTVLLTLANYLDNSNVFIFTTSTVPTITFTVECSVSIQDRSVSRTSAQVTYSIK